MIYFRNYSKRNTTAWSLRLYLYTIQYGSYKHISQPCSVQFMRCSHFPIKLKAFLSCETLDHSNADAWCIRPSQYQLLNDRFWSDSSDNGSRYLIRFKATELMFIFPSFTLELWLILNTVSETTDNTTELYILSDWSRTVASLILREAGAAWCVF